MTSQGSSTAMVLPQELLTKVADMRSCFVTCHMIEGHCVTGVLVDADESGNIVVADAAYHNEFVPPNAFVIKSDGSGSSSPTVPTSNNNTDNDNNNENNNDYYLPITRYKKMLIPSKNMQMVQILKKAG